MEGRRWPVVTDARSNVFRAPHLPYCRELEDGNRCFEPVNALVFRRRTEQVVPVPTPFDAHGQHTVARILRRAGYNPLPPYHPEAHHAAASR